jgi:hypothetical protein
MPRGTACAASTKVPWARMGTRLAGGSVPLAIHACMAVSSARIGGPACMGLTGSAIVGAARMRSLASAKCGVPAIM